MKNIFGLIILFSTILIFSSCNKDEENAAPGTVEITFDNVAIIGGVQKQLDLVTPGSTNYTYTNGLNQKYNINILRYYISAIELTDENGTIYKDALSVDASSSKGYYLIDEAKAASQTVTLTNVPAGKYQKVTFTVGVDSAGVTQGAAGGSLDAANKMFWNWNSGYIAFKFEGQSDVSNGGVTGAETITSDNSKGMAYHVGGWKNVAGTAFVYNNKKVTLNFDTKAEITSSSTPEIHLIFDVLKVFNGHHKIDFTGNHNVHKPSDGVNVAHNIEEAFTYDHIHQ